jgi:hypothetical protein
MARKIGKLTEPILLNLYRFFIISAIDVIFVFD